MEIAYLPYASHNFKDEVIVPKYLILHCIGGTQSQALKTLTLVEAAGGGGVSAHYFIPQANTLPYPIYQLVEDNKLAFHAGKSQWHEHRLLNVCSIGIEFHCPDYAYALSNSNALDWCHFEPFDELQIKAGITLIKALMQQYTIQPHNILAHSDIAPWRIDAQTNEIILGKTDPGATFPWQQLAHAGASVWPKAHRTRNTPLDTSTTNLQQLLAECGYAIEVTGLMDLQTQYTLSAFQLRFMPDKFSLNIDEKIIIYLENLIDRQYQY